jgi:hypothetical protein
MDASLSVGAAKELHHDVGAPTPSAKSQDKAEFTQSEAENTTLPQPFDGEVNESLLTESFSVPDQDVSAPPSSTRRGSQEATEPSHENVSHSQIYAEKAVNESQNAVQTGQHYPMSLDVSYIDAGYILLWPNAL